MSGRLDADDLVKIPELLSTRLMSIHGQSPHHIYRLIATISGVPEAMADTHVSGLNNETIHEPLLSYLDKLKDPDPYLMYRESRLCSSSSTVLYVPDSGPLWQGRCDVRER